MKGGKDEGLRLFEKKEKIMKIRKRKNAMSAAFAAILGLSAVSPIAAAYEDNDVGYQFHILNQQQNSRDTGRYRGTTDVNNAWKVWMQRSEEGAWTYTTYWLEHYNGDNVAASHSIRVEDGPQYYNTYSSASRSTVYLTAENNNKNETDYFVSGVWDEETGKHYYQ